MDKSIEQRAEERYPTKHYHKFDERVILAKERNAYLEGYKACQQNLEVSERLYTKEEMENLFTFTDWVGYNYVRLKNVWVHKYKDQRDKENWKSTKALYEFWLKHISPHD